MVTGKRPAFMCIAEFDVDRITVFQRDHLCVLNALVLLH